MATALLTRQRVLAAKIEATTGTPETLAAAQGLFNVFDAKIEPTIPAVEREGQSSLAPLAPVPGARSGKATFKTELIANGTAGSSPGWANVFLASCGMLEVTAANWKPLTGAASTSTIGLYQSGRLLKIAGAMGKFNLTAESGKPGILDWEFDGVWQAPTTASLLAPAYPTGIPPRVAACTFTIGSVTYAVPKVEVLFNNTLYMREDITQVSGYSAACITQRKITIKVSPEALGLSTQDWYAQHLASTGAAFSMIVGTGAGNMIQLSAPNLVLLNPPAIEDRSGLLADSLEFLCVRGSSAGDDELAILFS